jgi:hypothetical protein
MAAKRKYPVPTGLMLAALLILVVAVPGSFLSSAAAQGEPLWWEIVLNLKSDGEYGLEGGESACRGRFRFSLSWAGWMEKDDEDYLLYRFHCDLTDWQAEETTTSSGTSSVMLTPDFRDKPTLELKYIFRRDGMLHLNFVVAGIDVPQSDSEDSWPLLFPSSEENDQREGGVAYNTCLVKGSNRVALEEKEIYSKPVVRSFAWDWKHQQWLLKQQHSLLNSQTHRVEVSLSIIPHFATPKSRASSPAPGASYLMPGDGIYRTPGGDGRG